MPAITASARGFLGPGWLVFVGPGVQAATHAHHAVQLVAARADLLSLTLGGERLQRRATWIPANMPHALDAVGRDIVLLLVDPQGDLGRQLDLAARAARGAELGAHLVGLPLLDSAAAAEAWSGSILRTLGIEAPVTGTPAGSVTGTPAAAVTGTPAAAVTGTLAGAVTGTPAGGPGALSSVSSRAMAAVEATLDRGVPRVGAVAATLGISASRLTHVFTREVGLPFRRYVLWARIQRAAREFHQHRDLTRSAHAAGFSDGAHFSRTFRAMFGLPPSLVLPALEVTASFKRLTATGH